MRASETGRTSSEVRGRSVDLHANFLCVETFHTEVGCSSVLFNDPYGVPAITLEGDVRVELVDLLARLEREHEDRARARDVGDAEHGFPYLSGRGRLVVKDAIMLGAAVLTMADSARLALSTGKARPSRDREGTPASAAA